MIHFSLDMAPQDLDRQNNGRDLNVGLIMEVGKK
jgi:hypothetical protein